MAAAPELEPAAAWTIRSLLVPFALLAGSVVAWGLVKIVDGFLRAFFGFAEDVTDVAVGWIPVLGKLVKHTISAAEQKATNELGKVAAGLAETVADSFHGLATAADSLGHEVYGGAIAFWMLTEWLVHGVKVAALGPRLDEQYRHLRAQGARLGSTTARANTDHKVLAHPGTGTIGGAIHAGLKPLTGEIGALEKWTLPRVKALDRDMEQVLDHSIPALRARTRELEDGASNTFRWIRRHPLSATTGVFAGAVAVALGRLGGGWIRCSNWRKIGRVGCRMPLGTLEGLIALFTAEEAIRDLPSLVREMQLIASETVEGIQKIAQV